MITQIEAIPEERNYPKFSKIGFPYHIQQQTYGWYQDYKYERNIGWRKISREICEFSNLPWDISFFRMFENWVRNLGTIYDNEAFEAILLLKEEIEHRYKKVGEDLSTDDLLSVIEARFRPNSRSSIGALYPNDITSDADALCGIWKASMAHRPIAKEKPPSVEEIVLSIDRLRGRNILSIKRIHLQDGVEDEIPRCGIIVRIAKSRYITYLWDLEEFQFEIDEILARRGLICMSYVKSSIDNGTDFEEKNAQSENETAAFWTFRKIADYNRIGGVLSYNLQDETFDDDYIEREIVPYIRRINRFRWRITI